MSVLPYTIERQDSNGWAKASSRYSLWAPRASESLSGARNSRFSWRISDLPRRVTRRWSSLLKIACCACAVFFLLTTLTRRWRGDDGKSGNWSIPTWESVEPSSLIYSREDLRRIWEWEIASSHYPSRRPIPAELGFKNEIINPAIPVKKNTSTMRNSSSYITETKPAGPRRVYLDLASHPPSVAYPPRPVPGSIADLDIIMDHCDFDRDKYVRDCLEVLRVGAGLDNGKRLRRENLDDWRYVFVEHESNAASLPEDTATPRKSPEDLAEPDLPLPPLPTSPYAPQEKALQLPAPLTRKPYSSSAPCDPDYPRLFHMFWTGPFTDKPYLALLSYLYTQNTGIHQETLPADAACRPQFWVWINPARGATVAQVFDQLKANSWSAPFLHHRFREVIKFQIWNTTEQLDSIEEIKNVWRQYDSTVFRGNTIRILPTPVKLATTESDGSSGPKSETDYDRVSVTMSDMARFVLCHRFGGIYLDADTLFLRDWEELWGWRGAFAYRWSRLKKYNTAVLRMSAGSALGSFIFRTAVNWGLNFHPMAIAKYLEEAASTGLLTLVPDALFDAAWLNVENYQRERPPQPFFTNFADLFMTPQEASAAPQALGFDGFFRGSFSYHFHNFWWQPFDPSRNWPDLGERFAETERAAREEAEKLPVPEKRDLDWSTVLKRTFEGYIRGEQPNMYGEWIHW